MSHPPEPVLSIVGELTILTAGDVKTALLVALEGTDELTVDLSGVTELDTAGLQVLLLAKREAAGVAKTVRFRSPSEVVMTILAITRLSPDPDDDRTADLVETR